MSKIPDTTDILNDISLLYELSLSVGTSLDLKTNCDGFLKTLLARKTLDFTAVWIKNDFLLNDGPRDCASLIYANPSFRVNETSLRCDHPMFHLASEKEAFSLASDEPCYSRLISERGIGKGRYAVFDLDGIGVLKLFSSTRESAFGARELNQLRNVVRKFAVSIEGCLSHERATVEIGERRKAQAEREKSDKALRESEERYRALYHDTPSMYFTLDERGRVIEVNRYGARQIGYTTEELTGSSVLDVFHPADRTAVAAKLEAAIRNPGQVFRWEFRKIRKDGTPVWVEEYVRSVNREDGSTRTMVVCQNVSERRAAEKALRESEELHRAVVEQSHDCIFLVDVDTRTILEANNALTQLVEYSREELQSMTLYDLVAHEKSNIDEKIHVVLEQGGLMFGPRQYRSKSGALLDVEVGVNVISLSGRTAMCVVSRDISDRLKVERERRVLEAQIQHAQKLKSLGVLAGGVAHDFNNLLTGVLGNAELALMQLPANTDARESVKDIKISALRAADLCQQLLAYSGKGKFVIQPLNLNVLITEMVHLLDVSTTKKARLDYALEPALPTVEADATQMRQVIMNLITNASESLESRSGVITLSTGVQTCEPGTSVGDYLSTSLPCGRYVFVEVRDDGCGMDDETREKIFDPFFTTKFTGRGLGLAAVLGIVRGHRGTINIASEPSRGTTFRVLLPASEKAEETLPKDVVPEQDWRGSGLVLVVDDEQAVRAVGQAALSRLGFEVMTARDGREAIEIYRIHRDQILLVLLDMTMPHLNGEETLVELRRIRPDVQVILTSGYNEQEATDRFAGLPLAGFLQKPYRLAEMASKLRSLAVVARSHNVGAEPSRREGST